MKPLFERLKEMVFKNTERTKPKNFFSQASPEELMQLKNSTTLSKPPMPNENKIAERQQNKDTAKIQKNN